MFTNLPRLLILAFLALALPAAAQTPAPETKKHNVADVVEWVRREGTEAILSHDVARIFGWGEGNVMVTRMAFTNPDNHNSYAFDVVREKPNVVMFWRGPDKMIVWQMSASGELLQTLLFNKTSATIVDNELFQRDWREALDVYFGFVPPRN